MVELTTAFAVLSLFLGWRLYVVKKHATVMVRMFSAMIDGKVEIRRTEKGIEMEIKENV